MKLIYIHIPKTAGSSLVKTLAQAGDGVWVSNRKLETLDPTIIWTNDWLAGHFTRQELMTWVKRNYFDLEKIAIATTIRHPFDQLRSNLNYPFELQARSQRVDEPWMRDLLATDVRSAEGICSVLDQHPWLLNLQWQFLVTGSYLEEALTSIDYVAVHPFIRPLIGFCSNVLGVPATVKEVYENRTSEMRIGREVFGLSPLRELILKDHALDVKLFHVVLEREYKKRGRDVPQTYPTDPSVMLDSWISEGVDGKAVL